MLKLILMENICLFLSMSIAKPIPGHGWEVYPPDSDNNLVTVAIALFVAGLAVLGVAEELGQPLPLIIVMMNLKTLQSMLSHHRPSIGKDILIVL